MIRKPEPTTIRGRLPLYVTLVVTVSVMAAGSALAGNLAVTTAAAYEGSYGLEVTVGSSCTSDAELVLDDAGTISTDQEGCDSITAGGATTGTTVSGTVTFTAGTSMTFANGFAVATGSAFTAAIDATLTPFAWVQDDSPANEDTYSAKFWVNADNLSVAGGEVLKHFVAYSGGTEQFRVLIVPGNDVKLQVRQDNGSYAETGALSLSTGWNEIDISWVASSSSTAILQVNSGTEAMTPVMDNDSARIASVRWGAVGGTVDSTSGSVYLDDFTSWS